MVGGAARIEIEPVASKVQDLSANPCRSAILVLRLRQNSVLLGLNKSLDRRLSGIFQMKIAQKESQRKNEREISLSFAET